MLKTLMIVLSIAVVVPTPAAPISQDDPEATDPGRKRISTATGNAVVVTANPLASKAGLAALQAGGSAIDALVSAQAVLAVVEPQSSGLGGGGFLLYWDAQHQTLEAFDGREVAPKRSQPTDLLSASGKPLPWREATSHPLAIGIPGTVGLLWDAHQHHGRLPWADTLTAAIELADAGFRPSPRFLRSLRFAQRLGTDHNPAFQALYLPGGQPPPADQRFRNPALARTLTTLAQDGGPAFYRGALAQQILQEVNALQHPTNSNAKGWSPSDLSAYAVERRDPLCSVQLQHKICTMPPPSSGGLGLLQTLALLNQSTPLVGSTPSDPTVWGQLGKAQAWADADRLYWVRDPRDGSSHTDALLNPAYIQQRTKAMQNAKHATPGPGLPPGMDHYPFGQPEPSNEAGTTQITIVDTSGNIAVSTASVETVFGSRTLVAGMVMNNQLTDFAFQPTLRGRPVANRRLPGRRPNSSMAPTLVFHQGQPVLALGSPGGRTIPHLLSRVLLASLIWNASPSQAVGLPHLSNRRGTLVLENNPPLPWPVPVDAIQPDQQSRRRQSIGSGTALIQRINGQWQGAADPRREGTALSWP
ncbi:MAG: gamma-glutamyltransferase family protein [Synechococcus sp.]